MVTDVVNLCHHFFSGKAKFLSESSQGRHIYVPTPKIYDYKI